MDFDKYQNKLTYPVKPNKPKLGSNFENLFIEQQADVFKAYQLRRAEYEKLTNDYNNQVAAYAERQLEIMEEFKADAFRELDIELNKKRHELFRIAWDYGHSSGYSEVFQYMYDLVDLIQD